MTIYILYNEHIYLEGGVPSCTRAYLPLPGRLSWTWLVFFTEGMQEKEGKALKPGRMMERKSKQWRMRLPVWLRGHQEAWPLHAEALTLAAIKPQV